jgi:PAS domain S-box-containing protein
LVQAERLQRSIASTHRELRSQGESVTHRDDGAMDVPCAVVVLPRTIRSVEGPARRLPEGPLVGTVDNTWRLAEISLDAAAWFGLRPEECRGRALRKLVHPDDAALLLLATRRSTVHGRGVAVGIRVRRHDGEWTPVRCEISPLCGHNPPRFALAMWA